MPETTSHTQTMTRSAVPTEPHGVGLCRQWVRRLLTGALNRFLAHQGVLGKAQEHADGSGAEAPVEALPAPHGGGEGGSQQATDVDAEVEDGEAGVATRIVAAVQLAEHDGGVRLHTTGTDGDEHEAERQTRVPGDGGQGNVAKHHHNGGVEQGSLRAEHAVSDECGRQAGEVYQATVGTHNGGRRGLVHAQAAAGDLVPHVVDDDGLHAVKGEAFPHLHPEEVGKATRLPEEGLLLRRSLPRICYVVLMLLSFQRTDV